MEPSTKKLSGLKARGQCCPEEKRGFPCYFEAIHFLAIAVCIVGHRTWTSGGNNNHPRGKVGILKRVEKSNVLPADRCFLHIDYEGSYYIGCLLCSDHAFCSQIVRILQANLNRAIAQIGSIDLTHTLYVPNRRPRFDAPAPRNRINRNEKTLKL